MYTTGVNCGILLLSAPGEQTRAKGLCQKSITVFSIMIACRRFCTLSGDSGPRQWHTAADLLCLHFGKEYCTIG